MFVRGMSDYGMAASGAKRPLGSIDKGRGLARGSGASSSRFRPQVSLASLKRYPAIFEMLRSGRVAAGV
jgi:hypothetical protein